MLCLLAEGFEEIELITPVDVLRRAGADATLAALQPQPYITGRCGMALRPDRVLAEVESEEFHLLLLPGGPGVKLMRADGRAAHLAGAFAARNLPVAAICAAPTILKDAGLLPGRRHTAHFSVYNELPESSRTDRVVVDGPIITSRGAGTALDFGLALVRRLYGESVASEVARDVMA